MAARKKPSRTAAAIKPPAPLTLDQRLDRLEDSQRKMSQRVDKIVDSLIPLLRGWRALRKRIPTWILPPEDILPDAGEE